AIDAGALKLYKLAPVEQKTNLFDTPSLHANEISLPKRLGVDDVTWKNFKKNATSSSSLEKIVDFSLSSVNLILNNLEDEFNICYKQSTIAKANGVEFELSFPPYDFRNEAGQSYSSLFSDKDI
ncbi:11503_t:CDS:2, partial [Dentiscutata erythropus]